MRQKLNSGEIMRAETFAQKIGFSTTGADFMAIKHGITPEELGFLEKNFEKITKDSLSKVLSEIGSYSDSVDKDGSVRGKIFEKFKTEILNGKNQQEAPKREVPADKKGGSQNQKAITKAFVSVIAKGFDVPEKLDTLPNEIRQKIKDYLGGKARTLLVSILEHQNLTEEAALIEKTVRIVIEKILGTIPTSEKALHEELKSAAEFLASLYKTGLTSETLKRAVMSKVEENLSVAFGAETAAQMLPDLEKEYESTLSDFKKLF